MLPKRRKLVPFILANDESLTQRVIYETEKTHASRRDGLRLVQTNKITRLNEQVTHDVSCCHGLLERWILIHPKGNDEKLTHAPVVNV